MKALSNTFKGKLSIGVVNKNEKSEEVFSHFNIKKTPSLLVFKDEKSKNDVYLGKEFKFKPLFEFLNVFS